MDACFDILIIGCGAAGSSAAFAAKKTSPALSVCVLGSEDLPVYSAPALPDLLSGELSREGVFVRERSDYESAGIVLRLGETVRAIDPERREVHLESGEALRYGELILATGSQPIRLRRMQGTDLPGNFVMKSMADVDAMAAYGGSRAVVVGSGAIGLEGSMALKARGFEQVTLVEALDWLSPKSLDKETSDELAAVLESFGVEVLTGEAVQGVLGETRVTGVRTAKRDIPCDLVLWGIGMRPDVELAKAAGIPLGQLGAIRVDERMCTGLSHVYACGDCVESTDALTGKPAVHLFWEPAQRGGSVAGANAAGADEVYQGSLAVFLTNKGGLSILALGKTAREIAPEERVILQEKRDGVFRRLLLEDGYLAGVQTVGSLADADLLCAVLKRNAERSNGWSLAVPVPEECRRSVRDVMRFLRRQRRG